MGSLNSHDGVASASSRPVHVLLACHNRASLSVTAVKAASRAAVVAGLSVDFVVYDDGSTDGTSAALKALPEDITVLQGTGDAYWAKSMSIAEQHVLRAYWNTDDLILWLNDDTVLDESALLRLIAATPNELGVSVGALRSSHSGEPTYGGFASIGWHPLRFEPILPRGYPTTVDTFNGNAVLINMKTALMVGGIDGAYSHALADIDYGLRCRTLGIPVTLTAETIGVCDLNPRTTASRTVLSQWRQHIGVKGGGNYRSMRRFVLRHQPGKWPLAAISSYTAWWIRAVKHWATR